MKIPSFVQGTYKSVVAAAKTRAKAFAAGASLEEIAGDMVDTQEQSGLLVVAGPSQDVASGSHFYGFAVVLGLEAQFRGGLPPEVADRFFREAIRSPWGLVAVMGQDSQQFVREQPYQGLLVNAVAAAWSELDGEGERYSSGGPTPSRFWKAARTPKFALARMGVPAEMLVQLPRGGFSEYLALLASRQS